MRRFITPTLLVLIGAQVVFLIIFTSYIVNQQAQTYIRNFPKLQTDADIVTYTAFWKQRMNNVGVKQAYSEYLTTPPEKLGLYEHTSSHIIGELLYRVEGIDGFTLCDRSHAYGCYHGFIPTALHAEGEKSIEVFNKKCMETFGEYDTACRHGIGHGLAEYYGYQHIEKALDKCTQIQQPQLIGCIQGVFMEYNFPRMTDAKFAGKPTYRFDPDFPDAPCSTVKSHYRPSCYYEITALWHEVYQENYQTIGALCNRLTNNAEKEACFLGTGRSALERSEYSNEFTLQTCTSMPTESAKMLCTAGATWLLIATQRYDDTQHFCYAYKEPELAMCLEKMKLIR